MSVVSHELKQHTQSIYDYKFWYTQPKPYKDPLPFMRCKFQVVDWQTSAPKDWQSAWYGSWLWTHEGSGLEYIDERSYAKAYDKFVAKCKDGSTASLGVSLAEFGEAVTLIHSRVRSLFMAWKAVRTFNLPLLYRALTLSKEGQRRAKGIMMRRGRKAALRDTSSVYLELVFGWLPMIEDIYSGVKVLASTPRQGKVVAKGLYIENYYGNRYDIPNPYVGNYTEIATLTGSTKTRIQAFVTVDNPNIVLLNQLGLVNPVQVAWDVIPLSFLVNWFLPVSQFLKSYSDLWGFNIQKAQVVRLRELESVRGQIYSFPGGQVVRCIGYAMYRDVTGVTIPRPNFTSRIKLPGGNSVYGKAVSAIALLVQSLTKR